MINFFPGDMYFPSLLHLMLWNRLKSLWGSYLYLPDEVLNDETAITYRLQTPGEKLYMNISTKKEGLPEVSCASPPFWILFLQSSPLCPFLRLSITMTAAFILEHKLDTVSVSPKPVK